MVYDSWRFLEELWNEDVENLVNESLRYLGESAHIDKGSSFEKACLHIQSLLDRPQQEQGYSYEEFLDVILKDEKSKISPYAQSVDDKEDEYLIHIWNSIYSKLKAPQESFKFLELNNPNEFCKYYPYALIGLIGIKCSWFARYNDVLLPKFDKNNKWDNKIRSWLNEGFLSRWRTKLRNKRVNSRRLMPLTVLLILLRREFNLCNQCFNEYLDIKMSNSGTDVDISKYVRCILGLYHSSGIQSIELIDEIVKEYDYLKFHPVLASLLIGKGACNWLYERYAMLCHSNNLCQKYKEYEYNGILVNDQKVLWYDFLFPYSRVSDNDYYILRQDSNPMTQLLNKVFLSFSGVDYHDHYLSDKGFENSLFDTIVLYEEKDRRLIESHYNEFMSTGGKYIYIKSPEDQFRVQYKEELSAFSKVLGGEEFFLKILRMSKSGVDKTLYLDCRSKVEESYKELQKKEIIPPGVKLSGLAAFLEGNSPRYELLEKELMPKPLRYVLDFFLKIANDVEHVGDDLAIETKKYVEETQDINLLRALAFIICDILLWYKDVTKKYDGNEGIWVERKPIEGCVEKDVYGRFHVGNCEVKSKRAILEGRKIKITSYCEHITYKKTGKGYKYYSDLDNQ